MEVSGQNHPVRGCHRTVLGRGLCPQVQQIVALGDSSKPGDTCGFESSKPEKTIWWGCPSWGTRSKYQKLKCWEDYWVYRHWDPLRSQLKLPNEKFYVGANNIICDARVISQAHMNFGGVSDLQMEQLGIWLKEISKAKGTPVPLGFRLEARLGQERGKIFSLKMHLLPWGESWESAVLAAQGGLWYPAEAQNSKAAIWAGASPKWFCSSLIWPDILLLLALKLCFSWVLGVSPTIKWDDNITSSRALQGFRDKEYST